MNEAMKEAREAAWNVYKPRRGFDCKHPPRVVNEGHQTLNAAIDAFLSALKETHVIMTRDAFDDALFEQGQQRFNDGLDAAHEDF